MSEQFKDWDGGDWQEHIARLLHARYAEPGMYQDIPARFDGDFGLEGFSHDGICYQCYAAEPPYTTQKLYEKQRNKVTDDIAKFIKNAKSLAKIFGQLKIKRWLLVVPHYHNKELLEHCGKKRDDVLKAKLPYVDAQFYVGVITDAEFAIELCRLSSARLYQHDIKVAEPDVAEVEAFSTGNVSLLTKIADKAAKLPKLNTPSKVDEFTLRMVQNYLRGQSAIDVLRARDPEQFETLLRCKSAMEEVLVMKSMLESNDASSVRKTFFDFKNDIETKVSVSPHTADVVAWGAVADWLLRCPLDF